MKNGIEHIIFDLGGGLLNIDLERISKGFEEIMRQDEAWLRRFKDELSPSYETGKISTREFLLDLSNNLREGFTEKNIISIWNSVVLDFPVERLQMLEELRKQYKVHLLSNINDLHARCFEEKFHSWFGKDPRTYFDQFFFSHEIGLRKPDLKTFTWALQQLKADGAKVVFIDDVAENIEGAKAAGMQAYQLIPRNGDLIGLIKKIDLI
jgi:putative hydrolase of the HAD superfamily